MEVSNFHMMHFFIMHAFQNIHFVQLSKPGGILNARLAMSVCLSAIWLLQIQAGLLSVMLVQVSPISVLRLICDEMLVLNALGLKVTGPSGQHAIVKFHFLFPICDYPGFRPLLGRHIKMMPATYGDYTSWHGGQRVQGYKTLYNVHAG